MKQAFIPKSFEPPFWMSNPHLQTILPKLFAPKSPEYRRKLVMDSLNESKMAYDFFDVEDSKDDVGKYKKPLVVLFHGLEGSSDSHYARSLAQQVHDRDWHYVVVHYRSCGGIPVSGKVFYNAGDTPEAHHALRTLSELYSTVFAVGVSLGGNLLAKYMGEYGDSAVCQSAVVASAPVDLGSSAVAMQSYVGKTIYTPYLLKPLIQKAIQSRLSKAELMAIKASKTVTEFDQLFTAPRHGFRSANDYYQRSSALPYLDKITKPTLLISAKDDPFLGMTAVKADVSDSVTILDTENGGHIGFVQYVFQNKGNKLDINWLPDTAIAFFDSNMPTSNT